CRPCRHCLGRSHCGGAQDGADLVLHRAAVACRPQPQLLFEGLVELPDGDAGHRGTPGASLGGLLGAECHMIAVQSMQSCRPWHAANGRPSTARIVALWWRWIGRRHGALVMMSSKLLAVTFLVLTGGALAQPAPPDNKPDATLRSTPETVVWGYFAAD